MNGADEILLELALVVTGCAMLAWLAVVARQPMIIAYIVCGALLGPRGLGMIKAPEFMTAISDLGVLLLLFLAGIVLHPDRLWRLFRSTTAVTLLNAGASFVVASVLTRLWGFAWGDAAFVGVACTFSSTILVVKLLPTTTLHQEHMGGLAIGVLILQDLLAVALLVVMYSVSAVHHAPSGLSSLLERTFGLSGLSVLWVIPPAAVLLTGAALLAEQVVLRRMMRRIGRFDEGIYLLALAWCLANATLWNWVGLSSVAGAFVAGVALARSPVSLFISEGLKPLRDFFLVLFFLMIGAQIEWDMSATLVVPAAVLAGALMLVKSVLFDRSFRRAGEPPRLASELGVRLGQLSEFGLIVAAAAYSFAIISHEASHLIGLTVILTMTVSAYVVVLRYPTPIGTRDALHRD